MILDTSDRCETYGTYHDNFSWLEEIFQLKISNTAVDLELEWLVDASRGF
jgi:hypothetical protein